MTSDNTPALPEREQIARFWQDIAGKNASLADASDVDRVEAFNEVVQAYWDGVALEVFEQKDSPRKGMCVTAHGAFKHFPLVMALVQQAPPSEYDLQAFRSRTANGSFSMGMDGFKLDTGDVLIGCFPDGAQVGFEIRFGKEIPSDFRDHARNMSFIMLDHVIGEYEFAVKTGTVQFVDEWTDAVTHHAPLNDLPPLFDRYWKEELGHTGMFPQECGWQGLELTFSDDDGNETDTALLTLNSSAGPLAMRADMTFALELIVPVEGKDDLSAVQDLQDQIAHLLEQPQSGLLVYTMLRSGRRHALYYVNDDEAALALARQQIRGREFELGCERDFNWSRYYRFVR